jgi:hypothetical protein
MIDWLVVLVALFLVAAGSRRGNHDEDKIAYILTFFGFIILLWGLGFLMPPADYLRATPPYFKAFLFGIASIRMWCWHNNGRVYLIGTIAEISLFVFIIMGASM